MSDNVPIASIEVSVVNLPLSWKPGRKTLEMHQWGLLLDGEAIPWADIQRLRYGRAKTSGAFRLKTNNRNVEISLGSTLTALAGLPIAMLEGASQDEKRMAWIHQIEQRAGLKRSEGRVWIELTPVRAP